MFLLINQEGKVIAADSKALDSLGAENIYELIAKQQNGEIDIKENTLISSDLSFGLEKESISSVFGEVYLYTLKETKEETHPQEIEEETELLSLLSEEESKEEPKQKEEELSIENEAPEEKASSSEESENKEEAPTNEESELLSILEENEEKDENISIKDHIDDEELFSILEESQEEIQKESTELIESEKKDNTPVKEEELFEIKEEEQNTIPEENAKIEELLETIEESNTPTKEEELFEIKEENKTSEEKSIELEKEILPSENQFTLEEPEIEEENLPISSENRAEPEFSKVREWKEKLENFQIDTTKGAEHLGLSEKEYIDLIQEFVGDSRRILRELEKADLAKERELFETLKDATTLLQLEPLPQFFAFAEILPKDEREPLIKAYRVILQKWENLGEEETLSIEEEEILTPEIEETTEVKEELPPIQETQETEEKVEIAPIEEEVLPIEEETSEETLEVTPTEETIVPSEKIELEEQKEESKLKDLLNGNIEPIAIDFSVKIASEDLSLPEELVLEFVNDFDQQGHEYLPVLIEAYENRDLDKLQKTAHMLKGAASNLRIEPMVENLYQLQIDEEIENAPDRIVLFAKQLAGLDQYLEHMNIK